MEVVNGNEATLLSSLLSAMPLPESMVSVRMWSPAVGVSHFTPSIQVNVFRLVIVLVSIWMLLQRTRLGIVIRAGVQDREMVEALGINVRRVFTMVFGLGVGLAALGGILAAPSMGLSNAMGESLFLNALIALAIGGLTNYPGAALGSVLVGLIQQFIIKYGQIGIAIPFTDIIFKPTPPLVPASTVLLMVIILLILPNGLLGKKE